MKRTCLALLLVLSLLLGLAACGARNTAQETTDKGLEDLRDWNVLALPQYWNTDGLSLEDLESFGQVSQDLESLGLSLEDVAGLAGPMTRHLSWQVISAQEDAAAGTATVTVELTNLDMAPILGQFLQTALGDALGSAFLSQDQQPTQEELLQQYLQTLTDLLNQEDLDTKTTTVDVSLTLVDGQWKITLDEALLDALSGGLLSLGDALTQALDAA